MADWWLGANDVDKWLKGPRRAVSQAQDAAAPSVLPPPEAIIDAKIRGTLAWDYADAGLLMHGICSNNKHPLSGIGPYYELWQGVIDATRARPDPMTIYLAFKSGAIPEPEFIRSMGLHKIDWNFWEAYWQSSLSPMTGDQLNSLFVRGFIDLVQYNQLITEIGARESHVTAKLAATFSQPTIVDLQVMLMRGMIDRAKFDDQVQRLGYHPDDWAQKFRDLTRVIPSVSDLVRFQVREAMDGDLASQLGLYDERPVEIERYFKQIGYDWGPGFEIWQDGARTNAQWSDIYWAAHWQPISPTQAYHMLHRLRPDRIDRYRSQGFKVDPFTIEDVRRHLRIADYPKPIRDYLAAIAYTPMRLVDIKNRLKFSPGRETEEWAVGQLKDRGYHPDDAVTAVDLFVRQANDSRMAGIKAIEKGAVARTWREVEKAYELGTTGRARALEIGLLLGMQEVTIGAILDTIDVRVSTMAARALVSGVRRDYLSGILSDAETQDQLRQAGLTDQRAQAYWLKWRIERGRRRRITSATEALGLFKTGLISEPDLLNRLGNLGYDLSDSMLLASRARVEVGQMQAKAMKAAQRESAQSAKELEATVRKAQAQVKAMQSDLARMTPVSKLVAWAKAGRISEGQFRSRLRAMGYEESAINLYWSDVQPPDEDSGGQEALPEEDSGDSGVSGSGSGENGGAETE